MAIEPGKHILSASEQYARMRILLPDFRAVMRKHTLIAEGDVRPTPLSAVYQVRLAYRGCTPPKVWVLSPTLVPREEGGKIPHMYDQERLCLYLPSTGQWSGEMVLAKVTVPWIALWLYHYEVWHAVGEWLGGGVEPDPKPPFTREKQGGHHDRRRRK